MSPDGKPDMTMPAFNVLFVGAGGIVFGNDWVRWNHSTHLERILGDRLRVVGIVDPNSDRFEWVMNRKRISSAKGCYADTRHYTSIEQAAYQINAFDEDTKEGPVHLIMLATPPEFRGSMSPGRNLEAQLVAAFGGGPAIFAEKPVTIGSADGAYAVAQHLSRSGNLVGVGYMLRYLKVVQKVVQLIRDNNLTVMSVSARYVTAYSKMRKADWWDKSKQGGPIVEQATHFCDLCRYLGGEVILDSVQATALEHNEPAGKLSHFTDAIDESKISVENRIPRATTAIWKYKTGAIGTLSHIVALHGVVYSNEIVVIADGYQMRLVDLYGVPKLFVRYPYDEQEVEHYYPEDDPFYNELAAICNSQDRKANSQSKSTLEGIKEDALLPNRILSSFEDATKTYEFTWAIRLESENK
ncbi:hypothetical protein N7510_008358 [Penicillium lagena]|uniref:uncharacterized protein n=1 Tax=Penicillium lagena TaxID=94218 RepID=UPI002540752B|nr:uncharacterized protein N7510_008358 [Penicillium lagena]KAJ5605577.1 hypothetical protein N7510_008358 [Penicillium lagena]